VTVQPIEGKRILIVEDEYLIASDLKRAFIGVEAQVAGPVGQLEDALRIAEAEALDAAVLDVNLNDTNSYPVADILARRSIPFMFLTGYDAWAVPPDYRSVPRLAKPFPMHRVITMVQELVT
jgi:DNA-binding response OmpR family regulator